MKIKKKVISIALTVSICCLFFLQTTVFAQQEKLQLGAYNLSGEIKCGVSVTLDKLMIKDENGGYWLERNEAAKNIDVSEDILSIAEEHENFVYMDMRTDNAENPYPEIEPTSATVMLSQGTGNIRALIGKDYRLYYAPDGDSQYEDISDKITNSSMSRPQFSVEKLGIYILFFNPKVYNVIFYLEEPIYEEGVWVNQDCIYEQINDLEYEDTIKFPEPPQKEGNIFTGWKVQHFVGGGGGAPFQYTMPQPITVSAHREFFATWSTENEYEPINIEISSNEVIAKGKENGKRITLKTDYGVFADEAELNALPEYWRIIGADDLIIESAARIDDKTVELVLSGNSSDKYTTSNIQIEFDSSLLLSEPIGEGDELVYPPDTKIKTDEAGVRARMYRSDNAVALLKQNRPSSGGAVGTSYYTVSFESNGGTAVTKQTVKRNESIKEPAMPRMEEMEFAGWFSDKELTKKYDFSSKVSKSFTLYAKWEESDMSEKQILLTIGEKTATVSGKSVTNDVAPKLVNDFAMIPVRFVAENLGAKVEWLEASGGTVKIIKDEAQIYIPIGEAYAVVNNETVKLDAPAFIENGRTYAPAGFICERLGAYAEWNEENGIITVTSF